MFEAKDLLRLQCCNVIVAPLGRFNAVLSLLQSLDRFWTPSAIGGAIERPYLALSRPISLPRTVRSPQPPRSNKPLRGLNRATVALLCLKPLANKARNKKRDRGRDSQPRPRPRLNSHPQGATKVAS